ncbi:hypothetical protein TeGR_g10117 [Tetraparma gracilis]|uniref:Secreted protein n=1 Tax=Tetraparma gracilis TaxID=2962635 RepID=A0ABQ6N6H3_9STRA|nr:hypothetical protein TeGR_g10117 [Tetraparma gracilis]
MLSSPVLCLFLLLACCSAFLVPSAPPPTSFLAVRSFNKMGGKEDRSILSRSSEDAAMYIQGQGPRVAASSAKGARVREGNPLRQSGRTPVDWGKGGKLKVPWQTVK